MSIAILEAGRRWILCDLYAKCYSSRVQTISKLYSSHMSWLVLSFIIVHVGHDKHLGGGVTIATRNSTTSAHDDAHALVTQVSHMEMQGYFKYLNFNTHMIIAWHNQLSYALTWCFNT